jgi:hypothetical protein
MFLRRDTRRRNASLAYKRDASTHQHRLRFFRTISTETLTAENWSSARGLEWNGVSLTTLIARDFKSLAFSARSPRATKVCATRISTGFASLRVSQVSLSIILLLSFGKGKGGCTFRACNLKVWHGALFSMRARLRSLLSLLFGTLALSRSSVNALGTMGSEAVQVGQSLLHRKEQVQGPKSNVTSLF